MSDAHRHIEKQPESQSRARVKNAARVVDCGWAAGPERTRSSTRPAFSCTVHRVKHAAHILSGPITAGAASPQHSVTFNWSGNSETNSKWPPTINQTISETVGCFCVFRFKLIHVGKVMKLKTILRCSAEGEFRKEAVLYLHLLCEGGCKNKQETKVPGQSFNRLLYETWEN